MQVMIYMTEETRNLAKIKSAKLNMSLSAYIGKLIKGDVNDKNCLK